MKNSQNVLSYDLIPGERLGPFVIGKPISEVIAHLKEKLSNEHGLQLLYSEEQPLGVDIVLRLTQFGIQLRFSPFDQLLRVIEVFDLTKISLTYNNKCFSSPEVKPTFPEVDSLFRPSYPGTYDPKSQKYKLSYTGLSFFFRISSKYSTLFDNEKASLPLKFPDGSTAEASRVCLYSEEFIRSPRLYKKKIGYNYFDITPGVGFFILETDKRVFFEDSVQDVLNEIGPPNKIYYKSLDKRSAPNPSKGTKCEDYFFNYFRYGIDIMFDSLSSRVKKIILHTNFPGHFDFNVYQKCNFILRVSNNSTQVNSRKGSLGQLVSNFPAIADYELQNQKKQNDLTHLENDLMNEIDLDNGNHSEIKNKKSNGGSGSGSASRRVSLNRNKVYAPNSETDPFVSCDSKWDTIQEVFGAADGEPVVFNRGSTANPFGHTLFYGYDNLIFEVMGNNHIASVTLLP